MLGAVGIVTVPGIVVDRWGDRIYQIMRQEPQIATWRIAWSLVSNHTKVGPKGSQN